jgi:hypothetical protein
MGDLAFVLGGNTGISHRLDDPHGVLADGGLARQHH